MSALAALTGCSLVANLAEFDDAVSDGVEVTDGAAELDSWSTPQEAGAPNEAAAAVVGDGRNTEMVPSEEAATRADAGTSVPDAAHDGDSPANGTGDDAANGTDATANATDDAANGTDAAPNVDAGDEDDSPTDAVAGDGAGSTGTGAWCATHSSSTTLDCYDFDEGQPARTGFESNYFSSVFASVTSADWASGSPPSALLLATPALGSGARPALEQFNDTVSYHDRIELTFALKIVNYDVSAPDVSLFRVSLDDNSWSESLDFQQRTANLIEASLLANGSTQQVSHGSSQPSTLNAWTNVDILFDFAAHTVSLSYNGVVASKLALANRGQGSPSVFVQIGLNYLTAPVKAMTIEYDDIQLSSPP
jgi:hypothetical protein